MLDPLTLRAVIFRTPQYERAVYLLRDDWQRFVVSHPISPTTINAADMRFVLALVNSGAADGGKFWQDDFLTKNDQWLGEDARQVYEEAKHGRK
jgi:hypothetical protein